MADAQRVVPVPAFNFKVEIVRDDGASPLAQSAFSECDGLEVSQEVKTLREGGNPGRVYRLPGPIAFGQLTLKRGVTKGIDLWQWFSDSMAKPSLRANVTVTTLMQDGTTEWGCFKLSRCLPIKVKAPSLNAKDGVIAVEEVQIAYESFTWEAKQHA